MIFSKTSSKLIVLHYCAQLCRVYHKLVLAYSNTQWLQAVAAEINAISKINPLTSIGVLAADNPSMQFVE